MTDEDNKIAYEILDYLIRHEDAQDTLEGIAHWWLIQQSIEKHLPRVRKALATLVEQDLVLAHEARGTETRYGINPQKHQEILELLKDKFGH